MARKRVGLALGVTLGLAVLTSHAGIVLPLPQPSWAELSAEQKRVLAPLSAEWDKMDGIRRKKWIGIAQRYSTLTPDEQARMQRRMTAWAKLTPEERKHAREGYKSLQKAPPEKKEAVKQKWQEYKELPDSEKARLKAEATKKPAARPSPTKAPPPPKQPPPATPAASSQTVTPSAPGAEAPQPQK